MTFLRLLDIKQGEILSALIGSHAHGLAGPESDTDYRGVFVQRTSELLSVGSRPEQTRWVEGQRDDNTAWEIGHFLFLATKCNPTILEVFASPSYAADSRGEQVRALFPYLWNSKGVKDAFCGYGHNQRKKFLEDKDRRRNKYATAYVRTLYNAHTLLTTGTFQMSVVGTEIEDTCRRFRSGDYRIGEVIETCAAWEEKVQAAYEKNPDKQTDLGPVNELLLQIRKENW